jgi:hypothetical protein
MIFWGSRFMSKQGARDNTKTCPSKQKKILFQKTGTGFFIYKAF